MASSEAPAAPGITDNSDGRRWWPLWLWGGLMLLWGTALVAAGWPLAPLGRQFLGALANPGDASVYLSAIRQGAEGAWLFDNQFTPEATPGYFMYLPYLLLGRLAGPAADRQLLWWHGARLAGGAAALASLALLVRAALPDAPRAQRTAWLLAVFGGGFGWLVWLLSGPTRFAPDLVLAEWSLFQTLLNPAHFGFGLAAELLFLTAVIRAGQVQPDGRNTLVGGLAGLALALFYPFQMLLAGLVGVLQLAQKWRRLGWRQTVVQAAALLGPMAPFALYYGVWLPRDPLWQATQVGQNVILAPPPVGVVVGLGGLGLLAAAGWPAWRRAGYSRVVPLWAAANLLLLYAPVPYAGRFALGLTVPAALLAAAGLAALWQRRPRWVRLGRPAVLLSVALTPLLASLLLLRDLQQTGDFPLYMAGEELAAIAWLAERTTAGDLVLAYHQVGNVLPRYGPARVFIGQKFLTVAPDAKAVQVHEFWHAAAPPGWREGILVEWGIDYIYYGRYEQAITVGQPPPLGRVVYDRAGVTIYAVAR